MWYHHSERLCLSSRPGFASPQSAHTSLSTNFDTEFVRTSDLKSWIKITPTLLIYSVLPFIIITVVSVYWCLWFYNYDSKLCTVACAFHDYRSSTYQLDFKLLAVTSKFYFKVNWRHWLSEVDISNNVRFASHSWCYLPKIVLIRLIFEKLCPEYCRALFFPNTTYFCTQSDDPCERYSTLVDCR